ncbi:proline iminopeptidase [Nemania sp. FL0916]|nr:proline iminopeptidase [Nemania sp. FL0916]
MTSPVTGYTHEPAYDSGHLKVGSIHEIYYEQYGKKDGLPVIYLHGGPGGSTSPSNTVFFDPSAYRVILLDQRGAGKSRPRHELRENTTQFLSNDIESLRKHLGIARWHMVFGGSWGSTLGLFYAQSHPTSVRSLVLRGVFLVRRDELLVNNAPTAALFYPQEWDAFVNYIPEDERGDIWDAYHRRLTSEDRETAVAAANVWNFWDLGVGNLLPNKEAVAKVKDPDWSLTHALFESHYLYQNAGFMEDGELLFPENMRKIRNILGVIVQGRYDLVCPPKTASDVHKAWPNSSLHWVDDAGHAPTEPGTLAKLVQVCDDIAKL